MIIILPLLMAFLARLSGGGLFAGKIWSRLPELLFTWPFGLCLAVATNNSYIGLLGWIWSYFAMETGHGTFYEMIGYHDFNRDPNHPDKPRVETIEKAVRPVFVFFGGKIDTPLYSWVCMGFKGFLIGLPVPIFGLSLILFWPFSYWIGQRVEKYEPIAEWLSGLIAGTVVLLFLVYIHAIKMPYL